MLLHKTICFPFSLFVILGVLAWPHLDFCPFLFNVSFECICDWLDLPIES